MRLLLTIALLTGSGCTSEPKEGTTKPIKSPIVVLASFDTTRTDAISAYGGPDARTPVVDGLAKRGVRFEWALTPLPTTLGSHTAMMSGLDTHGSGVPRNGTPVPPDIPLLAERLEAAGWDRIAVVGAMPLESDMGLNRGFRVYRDTEFAAHLGKPRRSADQVTAEALKALDKRPPGQPTFLFVHYYDPHSPWEAAPQKIRDQFVSPDFELDLKGRDGLEMFRMRVRSGRPLNKERVKNARKLYLAQVHWTDQQFGVLLDGLKERGLMDDALIIMTADHGEMLDERHLGMVYTHGPDVDLPVIRVPMVIAGTGQFQTPTGQVVDRRVRLQDIANTVLTAAGLPANLGNGESLQTVWAGKAGAPPAHFAEATRSGRAQRIGKSKADEWPNINYERAVIQDDRMLVRIPWRKNKTRLFKVDAEQTRVAEPEKTEELLKSLAAWDAVAPSVGAAELDPETEEALRQLGYLE